MSFGSWTKKGLTETLRIHFRSRPCVLTCYIWYIDVGYWLRVYPYMEPIPNLVLFLRWTMHTGDDHSDHCLVYIQGQPALGSWLLKADRAMPSVRRQTLGGWPDHTAHSLRWAPRRRTSHPRLQQMNLTVAPNTQPLIRLTTLCLTAFLLPLVQSEGGLFLRHWQLFSK